MHDGQATSQTEKSAMTMDWEKYHLSKRKAKFLLLTNTCIDSFLKNRGDTYLIISERLHFTLIISSIFNIIWVLVKLD